MVYPSTFIPVDGGDDAVGHGAPQLLPQRIADGRHRVPPPPEGWSHRTGRASGRRSVDLQHRQIALCILSHQQGLEHTRSSWSTTSTAPHPSMTWLLVMIYRVLRHHHAGAQAHAAPLAPRMLTMEAMFSR